MVKHCNALSNTDKYFGCVGERDVRLGGVGGQGLVVGNRVWVGLGDLHIIVLPLGIKEGRSTSFQHSSVREAITDPNQLKYGHCMNWLCVNCKILPFVTKQQNFDMFGLSKLFRPWNTVPMFQRFQMA